MPSQAEMIISYLFKRSGKEVISYSDFYLTLSMELNWFTPDEAKNFIEKAIENNLLNKDSENLKPCFDYSKIKLPLSYVPTGIIFKETKQEKTDILNEIINNISSKTKISKKEILEEITRIESKKNLTREISALLLCKEYQIDIKRYL